MVLNSIGDFGVRGLLRWALNTLLLNGYRKFQSSSVVNHAWSLVSYVLSRRMIEEKQSRWLSWKNNAFLENLETETVSYA